MIKKYIIVFIALLSCSYIFVTSSDNIMIEPKSIVTIGTDVKITCEIEKPTYVTWSHNSATIAENSHCYNNICKVSRIDNKFILSIRKVNLTHSGEWACKNTNISPMKVNLNVTVPWSLTSIKITKIAPSSSKSSLVNKGEKHYVPGNQTPSKTTALETGSKRLPYELLNNESLQLVCQSECGLPPPQNINLLFINETNPNKFIGGKLQIDKCKKDIRLQVTSYHATINCRESGLTGRNKLYCQATNLDGKAVSTKSIYVICDSKYKYNVLIKGELIAIIVGFIFAIFDTVIIVLLLRRQCRHRQHRKLSYRANHNQVPSEVML